MTILAAFDYTFFGILLADSRLSGFRGNRLVNRRDICQKILPLGPYGLMAWSGSVEVGRAVMVAILERTRGDGPWWLYDAHETEKTLMQGYEPPPVTLPGPEVSLIIQLMNPSRRAFENESWPRVDSIVVDVRPFSHEVVAHGEQLRGSGSVILPQLQHDDMFLNIGVFGSATPDFETAVIGKCFLAFTMTELLIQQHREETVGGLYQVGYLLPDRARVLSYERWLPLNATDTHGTFVQLAMEDGVWLQQHRPTGLKRRLLSPLSYLVEEPLDEDILFDASQFQVDTPGVTSTPMAVLYYKRLGVHAVGEGVTNQYPYIAPPAEELGPPGTYQRIKTLR